MDKCYLSKGGEIAVSEKTQHISPSATEDISHIAQYIGCCNHTQYSMGLFYVVDLLLSLISHNSVFLNIK